MTQNEEFLLKVLQDTGRTNLSDYFTNYLKDKEQAKMLDSVPKEVMLPASMQVPSFGQNIPSSQQPLDNCEASNMHN